MKKISFLLIVVVLTFTANAQDSLAKKFMWSLGVEPSIPIGNFHEYSGFGLGGSLQGEYKPGRIGITLDAGYINYFGKSDESFDYPNFKYIPVLAGLKYYMSTNSFLHAQAGPGFGTNDLGTSFWYGAGVGFNLGRSADIELKYTGWHQNEVEAPAGDHGSDGDNGNPENPENPENPVNPYNPYGGHYSTIDLRLAVKF
jgi:hypothetical protein